jgi:hypothetical protein
MTGIAIFIALAANALGNSHESSPAYDAAQAVIVGTVKQSQGCDKRRCSFIVRIDEIIKRDYSRHLVEDTTIQLQTRLGTIDPPKEQIVFFLAGRRDPWRLVQDETNGWGDPGPRCAASGGKFQRGGLAGNVMCIRPYADAGKPCTDAHQCLGGCEYNGPRVAVGTNVTGTCKKDNYSFGRRSRVIDGKFEGSSIVD